MNRIPSGLPDNRPQFEISRYFKVIQKKPSIVDENVNDRIQREGVEYWGGGAPEQLLTGSEAEWYMRHKGYSENR